MAMQILRPKDVAKKLSISLATLWRLTHNDDFPAPIRISKKAVGWNEEDLNGYLLRRAVKKAAPAQTKQDN